MGIPSLSPYEQIKVYQKLIRPVEKKNSEFAHRIDQMKYDREGRTPNEEFVKRFHDLVDEELRLAEQDELVVQNRKTILNV